MVREDLKFIGATAVPSRETNLRRGPCCFGDYVRGVLEGEGQTAEPARERTAEPARAAEQRGKSSGGPRSTCCTSWGSGSHGQGIIAVHWAVRCVRLGCRTWALRARCADNQVARGR
jgi:hypothetical protein